MLCFWNTQNDGILTVDDLLEENREKLEGFQHWAGGAAREETGVERLKRCFDLADQLFHQTLVRQEALMDACQRLKTLVDGVYEAFGGRSQEKWKGYYLLACGNVRFRTALIVARWKPMPYHLCYEAGRLFQKVPRNGTECDWLARLMAAKCTRELDRYQYHYDTGRAPEHGGHSFVQFRDICALIPGQSALECHVALDAAVNMGRCLSNCFQFEEAEPYFACVGRMLAEVCEGEAGQNTVELLTRCCGTGVLPEGLKKGIWLDPWAFKAMLNRVPQAGRELHTHYIQALVNLVACIISGRRAYALAQQLGEHVLKGPGRDNVDLQNNLARLYRKQRDYQRARTLLRQAIETMRRGRDGSKPYVVDGSYPVNDFAQLEWAKCDMRVHNYTKARERLESLVQHYPEKDEILFWVAIWDQEQMQLSQAVQLLEQICGRRPAIRRGTLGLKANYIMGTCYLYWNDPAKAKACFQRIVREDRAPEDPFAEKDLGWCRQLLGEYQQAIFNYQRVETLLRHSSLQMKNFLRLSTYNNLAQCHLYLGEYLKALDSFSHVLEQEPGNVRALCGAAHSWRKLAEYGQEPPPELYARYEGLTAGKPGGAGEEGHNRLLRLAVGLAGMAQQFVTIDPHVDSEYMLCLLAGERQEGDSALHWMCRRELERQVQQKVSFLNCELCVEALAALGEYAGEKGEQYTLFRFLRPIKGEAAAEQVSALVDSPEFQTLGAEQQGELLAYVYQLHHLMEQIKITLRLNRTQLRAHPCWHYTRMETMKKLLLPQNGQSPRFRLSNVAYMNDSAEGESFDELMEQLGQEMSLQGNGALLKAAHTAGYSGLRNVYLTSLCTKGDYIYMWAIYADRGTGCSFVFDEEFFDVKDRYPQGYVPFYQEVDSYPLYWIVYLPGDDGGTWKQLAQKGVDTSRLDQKLKDLERLLSRVEQMIQTLPGSGQLMTRVSAMLDQVRYLFKYDEYASEEEVRCLVVTRQGKIEPGDGDTPYLYTEIQKEIQLEELRFGPKVPMSPEKEAWLTATGRVKTLSRSKRHYR